MIFSYPVLPPATPERLQAWASAVEELTAGGIDRDLVEASIRVGIAPEQEQGWARAERRAAERARPGQSADMRRVNRWTRQARQVAATSGIGFYGVKVVHGVIKLEAAFSTMRRPRGVDGPRYDSTGMSAADRLYLPLVPLSMAASFFSNAFDHENYSPDQFWTYVLGHPEVGIFLEEGAKKALARLSAGGVAIGLGGIDGGFQAGSGGRLQSFLKKLAKGGRQIIVQFDRPGAKESEIWAGKRMVRALRAAGAEARLALWGDELGKGTDDVLANLHDLHRIAIEDFELLQPALRDRVEDYLRVNADPAVALAKLTSAEQVPDGVAPQRLSRPPWQRIATVFQKEHILDGIGLDEEGSGTWEGGYTLAIAGATGTGKTEAVLAARDSLVEAQPALKILTICPTYRASLAGKYAEQFGVPLIRGKKVIKAGASHPGATFCLESSLRPGGLSDLCRRLDDGARALVLLDEVDQVVASLLCGGTEALVENRRETFDWLLQILGHRNVLTVAADAGLSDMTIDFLERATGRTVRLISTSFTWPKSVVLVDHKAGLTKALKAAADGSPVRIAVATPKRAAEVVEALAEFIPIGEILSITGENSGEPEAMAFVRDPDGQAPRWRALVHTQALVSGVSLTAGHFQVIVCLQDHAIGPGDVVQLLNRDRRAQKRYLALRPTVPQACPGHRISAPAGVARYYSDLAQQANPERFITDLQSMPPWLNGLITRLEAQQVAEALNSESTLRRMLAEEGYQVLEGDDAELPAIAKESGPTQPEATPKDDDPAGPGAAQILWQLVTGEILLDEHHEYVDHVLGGGLPTDRIRADLTEKLALARILGLDKLTTLGASYSANSPEVQATWEALCTADHPLRQRLTRNGFFQKKTLIPGCDRRDVLPPLNMRTIGALLAKVGGKQARVGRVGAGGKDGSLYRVAQDLHGKG
jgi:hypothetical protein